MPAIAGYAHLAQDPTHAGGVPRVADAGVRVYSIWCLYQAGWTPQRISEEYSRLTLGAVFSALAYAVDHPEEMAAALAEDEKALREIKANLDPELQGKLEHAALLL